jgi:hypothetical protein
MLRARIVSGWALGLVLSAALGPACSGSGDPAPLPTNTFGTEPVTVTGNEPAGTSNESSSSGSLEQLCAAACANIQAMCPGTAGGTDCAASCASSAVKGCEAQFSAFLSCVATSPLSCNGGNLSAPACTVSDQAVSSCIRQNAGGAT